MRLKDMTWHELLGLLAFGSDLFTEEEVEAEMARKSTFKTKERPSWQKGKFAPRLEPKNNNDSNAIRSERNNLMRRLTKKANNKGEIMETTMQEVWTEKRQDTSIEKTAEFVLDILTMGAWACWDGDKIERMKKELVNKYEDDGVAGGLEMDSETNEQKSSNYIRG